MRKRLLMILALLAGATGAHAADFTVDASLALKAADHAASGALYGIAAPGWPPQNWIDDIHPRNFTQMAPGGGQLPNGEPKPVGDALTVAPIAAKAGASVTIRLADTFPSFPYIWQGSDFWRAAIDRIVKAVVAANPPNIYAYEIWNEPDWTWQSQWGDFDAMWAATWRAIRGVDPLRKIMGPSFSRWDAGKMRQFLAAAQQAEALPDIVSWHELDPADADDIEAHVIAYRAIEKDLGLLPHPISINEYGSQRAMATPGALLHYIAQIERAGIDTADLAFWHRPGRLSDLLVPKTMGTGPATDPEPTGAYWLYKWYGEMIGNMVAATAVPGGGLDGIAAYDADEKTLRILIGGRAGRHTIAIHGLKNFGPTAFVATTATRWTGTDGALKQPGRQLYPTQAPVGVMVATEGSTIDFNVSLDRDTDAVEVVVTPFRSTAASSKGGDGWTIYPPLSLPITQHIEAEDGTVTHGRRFTIRPTSFSANRASGDAYVGFFNQTGAALSLPVSVAKAGRYDVALKYSNGQAAPQSLTLAVNGATCSTLDLLPTQGRELFGLAYATITLPAGISTLSLIRSGPPLALIAGPSVLELDDLELSSVPGGAGDNLDCPASSALHARPR